MKYLFSLMLTIGFSSLYGQLKPDIFPEDIETGAVEAKCYCNPGVVNQSRSKGLKIYYRQVGQGQYEEENNALSPPFSSFKNYRSLDFDLKVPVFLKEHTKILVGYKYHVENFNFNQIGQDFSETFSELNTEALKSSSLSIIVSKPINDSRYLAFRLRYSANGDYNGLMSFDDKYAIYKFLGLYGFKKTDFFEWGIGLNVSKSFRRTSILPFVLLNKTFNSKWGIEAAIPGYFFGRYNLKKGDILLFGLEYGSKSYRIDYNDLNNQPIAYDYNHSEIMLSAKLEHKFSPWIWGKAEAGFQKNFSSDFEGQNDISPSFNAEPSAAPYFRVGIFISPPEMLN